MDHNVKFFCWLITGSGVAIDKRIASEKQILQRKRNILTNKHMSVDKKKNV